MVDVQNFNLVPNDEEEEFLVDFGEVTQISTSDFNKLENRPSYAGEVMTGDTNIPEVPSKVSQLENDAKYQTETELADAVSAEAAIRYQADTGLQQQINGKQNTLTAGSNITITGDTISATDTTYTAGTNVSISSENVISATDTTYSAGANVSISNENVISAIDTTYTAGAGLSLNGTEFSADTSVLQEKLTAGNAINITNNTISADIYPADFFTANATTTGTGTGITLNNTIHANLKSVELNGDTTQQTYSGKNLVDFSSIYFTGVNGGTGTRDGITYTVNGASNDKWGGISFGNNSLSLKTSTTYTFSATVVSTTATNGSVIYANRYMTSSGTYAISNLAKAGERAVLTFTTPNSFEGGADLRLVPYEANNTTTVYTDLMVEENSSVTDYEPYVGAIPSPNPDYPQPVQTVTGEQTVTISDGTNSQTCTVDLGSIELCKIGTYQDYIYKGTDGWYVHNACGKVVLDGSEDENWSTVTVGGVSRYYRTNVADALIATDGSVVSPMKANYYSPTTPASLYNATVDYGISLNTDVARFRVRNKDITTTADFKTWLSTHNTIVYYPLANATDTKITDATLISGLDALAAAKSYLEQTSINVTATGTNLPAILDVEAYKLGLAGMLGAIGDN